MQGHAQETMTIDNECSSWAEAMQKVFRKKPKIPEGQFMLLCKVKKQDDSEQERKAELKERAKKKKLKRKFHEMARVKPDPLKKDQEMRLRKIATKGVVHLYRQIEKHRKGMNKELKKCKTEGQRDKIREKVLKKNFSDIVEGGVVDKNEDSKKGGWKVLQDDFMPKGEVKEWDNEDEEE